MVQRREEREREELEGGREGERERERARKRRHPQGLRQEESGGERSSNPLRKKQALRRKIHMHGQH